MLKVGILGASGFIGNRATELWSGAEGIEVVPIVRAESSLERVSTKGLETRIANALDPAALQKAFSGCDVVIHSVLGSPGLIRGSAAPAYRAAQAAGVRRLIYLSTFCVHGQAPAPGTTESSPLDRRQPLPYNTAKIDAERTLLGLRQTGTVEVVMVRPGIVFGPGSKRVREIADSLLQGTAYLIGEGEGICNTTYIDNLVRGLQLALTAPAADRQAFFFGDRERVTWAAFYQPIAAALGIDPADIPHLECPTFKQTWKQRFWRPLWGSAPVQRTLALVSDDTKDNLKRILKRRKRPAAPAAQPKPAPVKVGEKGKPVVTQDMALLQQCRYQLPSDKAASLLGYEPIVSFPDACHASIAWLASVGYPVIATRQ